jgi:hypothetical protein
MPASSHPKRAQLAWVWMGLAFAPALALILLMTLLSGALLATGDPHIAHSPLEIVFVDPSVPGYQDIVEQLPSRARAMILGPNRDGVAQMTESLAGHSDIRAVHIVSRGSVGSLSLPRTTLSPNRIEEYTSSLRGWSAALSDDADILLYGCNVAAAEIGEALISRLAELTGADVMASSDPTSDPDNGGDWELKVRAGPVETRALTFPADYDYLLAFPTITAMDGSSVTKEDLVNVLLGSGSGVQVSNVVFTGTNSMAGKFITGTTLGFEEGIILCTGYATDIAQTATELADSSMPTTYVDPGLDALFTNEVMESVALAFDLVPGGDTATFRYRFGSEEYPEYISGDLTTFSPSSLTEPTMLCCPAPRRPWPSTH